MGFARGRCGGCPSVYREEIVPSSPWGGRSRGRGLRGWWGLPHAHGSARPKASLPPPPLPPCLVVPRRAVCLPRCCCGVGRFGRLVGLSPRAMPTRAPRPPKLPSPASGCHCSVWVSGLPWVLLVAWLGGFCAALGAFVGVSGIGGRLLCGLAAAGGLFTIGVTCYEGLGKKAFRGRVPPASRLHTTCIQRYIKACPLRARMYLYINILPVSIKPFPEKKIARY